MSESKNKLVILEGPDGSGKTTAGRLLKEILEKDGHSVVMVNNPGSSTVGLAIRKMLIETPDRVTSPTVEALCMMAALLDVYQTIIQPALLEGKWVICDRWFDTTLSHQAYYNSDQNLVTLINATYQTLMINDWATSKITRPQFEKYTHIFYFDVPVEISMQRIAARGGAAADRFDSSSKKQFEKIKKCYDRQMGDLPYLHSPSIKRYRLDATKPATDVVASLAEALGGISCAQPLPEHSMLWHF